MIVSASRRTDIPALYPEWFMNRIGEGYLLVRNPFNSNQVTRVDLSPEEVDVIVFWTKNPGPMLPYLDQLLDRGYRFYFQFTLTAYPKLLEPFVPPQAELLRSFEALSEKIGAEKVIWRFDPIVLSEVTPEHSLIEGFGGLACELRGATSHVVISFVDLYKSVVRNLDRLSKEQGVRFYDRERSHEQARRIASAMAETARRNSMEITRCAEKLDLSGLGIEPGKCIDDGLIKRLFGISVSGKKDKNQRQECRCVESRDIGQYNTCTHGCVYCYASSNRAQALANRAAHDPESPFLS